VAPAVVALVPRLRLALLPMLWLWEALALPALLGVLPSLWEAAACCEVAARAALRGLVMELSRLARAAPGRATLMAVAGRRHCREMSFVVPWSARAPIQPAAEPADLTLILRLHLDSFWGWLAGAAVTAWAPEALALPVESWRRRPAQ